MIVSDNIIFGGKPSKRYYSDEQRYLIDTDGCEYAEVCLPLDSLVTLAEGDPILLDDPEQALTRYINEQTDENDPDLVSATETLIKNYTEE